jgi:hypothetical protein
MAAPARRYMRTTRSGSSYVHAIDVLTSDAGRREIERLIQNESTESSSTQGSAVEDKSAASPASDQSASKASTVAASTR